MEIMKRSLDAKAERERDTEFDYTTDWLSERRKG